MGSRLKDFVAWLGAALVVSALLVGAPLLLLTAGGGWPGPTSVPTAEQVGDFFTNRLSDENVIAIFVIVGWLLWAHFVFVFLVELFNQVRDRESKELHTAAITQRAARFLVKGLFRLGATSTAILGVVGPTATAGAVVVMSNHVGAQELPDGGATNNETARDITTPTIDFSGDYSSTMTVVTDSLSPRDGRVPYLVLEEDTLWDISERHTGDPQRWREIFDASSGFVQPGADDRVLENPRLINPGMVLLLPGDSIGVPEIDEALVEAVYGPSTAALDSRVGSGAIGGAPQDDDTGLTTAAAPETSEVFETESFGGLSEPTAAPGEGSMELDVEQEQGFPSNIGMSPTTAAAGFGAGGVLFATFMAMRLNKTRRWTRSLRRPGEAVATLDSESVELEREVMGAADFQQTEFYGRAWRSLATRPMETDDCCLPLLAIRHHNELQVLMSEPREDAPFPWSCVVVEDDRSVWSIPIDQATMSNLPDERVTGGLPLMVTVGENLFVNLEAIGPIGLMGDSGRTSGLARAMVWELVTSPWIDGIDVRVTEQAALRLGLDVGENAIVVSQEVTASAMLATATLDSHRLASIHSARAILDAELHPTLVIGDVSDSDVLQSVLELVRQRRAPVGVVMLDDTNSAYLADIDAAGNLVLNPSGLRCRSAFAEVDRGDLFVRLESQRARLVNRVDGSDVQRDLSQVHEGQFARVSTLRNSMTNGSEMEELIDLTDTNTSGPSMAPPSVETIIYEGIHGIPLRTEEGSSDAIHHVSSDDTYVVDDDLVEEPGAAETVRDMVEPADDEAPTPSESSDGEPLLVEILGSPTIKGPLKEKVTEGALSLITFLAVEGDQSRQSVASAMYGAGNEHNKATLRSFVRRARAGLYPENFPSATDGQYRVSNVHTDFDLLVTQMSDADAVSDNHERLALMLEALTLIRGEPFGADELTSHWQWVDSWATQPRVMVDAAVADAVERTVSLALELERYDDALLAVRRGLLSNPYSEWLVCVQVELMVKTDHRNTAKECVVEYERRCVEEFGVEPSPEPRRLLTSIDRAAS